MHIFRKQSDFEAFERVMVEAHLRQLGGATISELDGSPQRSPDHEGIQTPKNHGAGSQIRALLTHRSRMRPEHTRWGHVAFRFGPRRRQRVDRPS